MKIYALALVALCAAGCAYESPTAPAPITITPVVGAISLAATSGTGSSAGKVYIVASVTDTTGKGLKSSVHFVSSVGSVEPADVMAGSDGQAQTTVTTSQSGTITATTAAVSSTILVAPNAPTVVPPITPTPAPQPVPVPPPTGTTPPTPPPALPPSISVNPVTATAGQDAIIATGPFFANGDRVVSWAWSFGDGNSQTATTTAVTHTYTTAGTYAAGLTASNAAGQTANASFQVTVNPAPTPAPTPTPTPPSTVMSLTMVCTAPVSKAISCNLSAKVGDTAIPSSQIISVDWDFGDGARGTTVPLSSHTYTQAGTFVVIATAIAQTGTTTQRATATQTVIVP